MKLSTIKEIIFAKHHLPKIVFTRTDLGIYQFNETSMGSVDYKPLFDLWKDKGLENLEINLKIRNWVIEDSI